jgi:hypothetical protein
VLLAVFTAHWRQRAAEDPSRDSSALGATALALGVLSVVTGFLGAGLSWDQRALFPVVSGLWLALAVSALLAGIIVFARGAWSGLLAVVIAGWPLAFIAGLWLGNASYDSRDYDFYGALPVETAGLPRPSSPFSLLPPPS